MTIVCNNWMICLILIWFFYGLSRMFQRPQLVWALRSSVWDVFINFLLIDATDRSKIVSDQKRFFIALSLYPLSFFANTPFRNPFTIVMQDVLWLSYKLALSLINSRPTILNIIVLLCLARGGTQWRNNWEWDSWKNHNFH